MSQTQKKNLDRSPFFCGEKVEIRSIEGDSAKVVVRGYAALFGVRSRVIKTESGQSFVEEIMPGAFDNTDFSDVQARFNHKLFLAVVPTLRYGVDERGLWYEYDHDDQDPDHVGTFRKIQRGDAKGSSFMFDEPDSESQIVTRENGMLVRKIRSFSKLWDMGPVVSPAYRQTNVTAFMRSIDAGSFDKIETPEFAALKLLERRKLEIRKTLI